MPFIASTGGRFGYGLPTSPTIISSNLQIWLDAANSSSYSGSGTAWSNLVPGKGVYRYNLVNSPSVSTISYNGKTTTALAFNGTNQHAIPSTSLLTLAQANNWAETREYWLYWPGTSGTLTMESGVYGVDVTWFDAQAAFIGGNLSYSVWQGSSPMTAYLAASAPGSNQWHHIVWQHNKGTNTMQAYINGVRTLSNASIARTTPDSAGYQFFPILMAGSATNFGTGAYLSGSLGVYRWYNRILTSNEIGSNYASEKGRFGRA